MEDIKSREDVAKMVNTFYVKVKEDEMLGPIFMAKITTDQDWVKHEIKLTDFWETTLLFKASYRGNPVEVHNEVDKENNYTIDQNHFGRWQLLWISNINEIFDGEVAQKAKNTARNMGHHLFLRMFQEKPEAKE